MTRKATLCLSTTQLLKELGLEKLSEVTAIHVNPEREDLIIHLRGVGPLCSAGMESYRFLTSYALLQHERDLAQAAMDDREKFL